MSTLKETLTNDLKTALKSQDKELTAAIRMLISAIQYGQTAAKPVPEFDSVLGYRKQLADSLEMFPKNGEKYIQVQKELEIVDRYLPKPPTDAELNDIISINLAKIQPQEKPNIGIIIKEIKNKFPTCDAKAAMALIQKAISEKNNN
ncbi:GatB/YqeY domain-containing protein [Pigmentibacter ruber]